MSSIASIKDEHDGDVMIEKEKTKFYLVHQAQAKPIAQ